MDLLAQCRIILLNEREVGGIFYSFIVIFSCVVRIEKFLSYIK
jgi:hypothetical protein